MLFPVERLKFTFEKNLGEPETSETGEKDSERTQHSWYGASTIRHGARSR